MLFALAVLVLAPEVIVRKLVYRPVPIDNPLKGLVPYSGEHRSQFPHSMEFNYFPLRALMPARGKYNWDPLESLLNDVASRGHQTIFRIWLEYPGQPSGLPSFLIDEGVKLTTYAAEDPNQKLPNYTPDYRNPKLQSALTKFIAALGKRYDGDPRVAYITAGLLGHWGEWHTYPRTELSPPKELETKVMDAYAQAFRRTPVLLRYPADQDANHASNRDRPFGYHDDSFAWATLETGKAEDSWFFVSLLKKAGATEKWRRYPIGGEIRPEAWRKVFDPNPNDAQIQDFHTCVSQTHATWLMDSGMFSEGTSAEQRARAVREVGRMGYEFTVTQARLTAKDLEVTVENRGVAPFYQDWPVELATLSGTTISKPWKPNWRLTEILPGQSATWRTTRPPRGKTILMRVPNPMPEGHPLEFANVEQDSDAPGWLTLCRSGG
jgi:hypothetical protein